MDDTRARNFFLEPTCARQRQYEALRAVFVDGLSQKDAAQRFAYSHGAFRLVVQQFRAACAAGTPPPFSPKRAEDDHPPRPATTNYPCRTSRRSPTAKP